MLCVMLGAACLMHAACSLPLANPGGLSLAKRPFYPYRDTGLLTPLRLIDLPRGSPGQRKKAVDSTFIRFGRSPAQEVPEQDQGSSEETQPSPQLQFQLADCRAATPEQLMRLLMSDPRCFRQLQAKAKRENVNDTFIRFG